MADNTDLLNQFRQIVREEVEAEVKALRRDISQHYLQQQGELLKLENRVKDIAISNTRLEKGQQEQGKSLEDLTLKVEVINTNQQRAEHQNQRDHAEIMEHLVTIADISGREHKALKKRVDQVEKHLNLPPAK